MGLSLSNMFQDLRSGKSSGGTGFAGALGSVFKGLTNSMRSKPCAGMVGVCPYSCKPLKTQTELHSGVSDEIASAKQRIGDLANTSLLQAPASSPFQVQTPSLGAPNLGVELAKRRIANAANSNPFSSGSQFDWGNT